MARPPANIYQKVAAHQTMVTVMYGYVQGRMIENPEMTEWELVKEFHKSNNIDIDVNAFYMQYKSYKQTFNQFQSK
jgi:hypothetical protein